MDYLTDTEALEAVSEEDLPIISSIGEGAQNVIHFDLRVAKPGPYVLVVTYMSDKSPENITSSVLVEANGGGTGLLTLYPCRLVV